MNSTLLLSPCEPMAINSGQGRLKQNFEAFSHKSPFHKMLFNLSNTFNIWASLMGPMNFLLYLHRQDTLCHQLYVWLFPPTSSIKCLSHVPKISLLNFVKAIFSGFDKQICSNPFKFFAAEIIFLAQESMVSFF